MTPEMIRTVLMARRDIRSLCHRGFSGADVRVMEGPARRSPAGAGRAGRRPAPGGLALRYTGDVVVSGRRREMEEVGGLLERAEAASGGLLVFLGRAGSGKTTMVEAAAGAARRRGFDVLRASPPGGQPGRLVWVQLLRDTGAADGLVAGLLGANAGPLDLDSAARHLVSGSGRLIVVDDVDRGGPGAGGGLSVVAASLKEKATGGVGAGRAPLGYGRRRARARA